MTIPETTLPSHPPAEGSSARRPPGTTAVTALSLLASVAITGLAWLLLVLLTPEQSRPLVAWTGGVGAVLVSAAVTVAAYCVLTARELRNAVSVRDGCLAATRAEDERLAEATVPALVEQLRSGASVNTALSAVPLPENEAHRRVVTALATEVHRGEGMRSAAMAACANAAGRVQALATGIAADLREMENKYTDADILGDLLHLDHRTAQTGRLADSIALLTGARSGRRWAKPIVMESILRGAMGRIGGYQRIRLHSTSEAAVAGHAAEGIMHALAELMDNATNFSPPTAEVHVYVEEVAAGIVITVEDSGLVMGEAALRRAQEAVSAESFDLSSLSGTRLGLPVVGRLARKHGLSVSFRPSAHGGTGVLMMIPQELVSEARRESRPAGPASQRPRSEPLGGSAPANSPAVPAPAPVPQPRRPEPAPERTPPVTKTSPAGRGTQESPEATTQPEVEYSENGLPRRRRGRTLAAARERTDTPRTPSQPAPRRTAEQSGSRFGAFRKAVRTREETTPGGDGAPPGEGATGPVQRDGRPDAPSPAPTRSAPQSSSPEGETE